jgi:hypothetical protein
MEISSYFIVMAFPNSHRARVITAARQEVRGQIDNFRSSITFPAPCAITGELIRKADTHIDHMHPLSFQDLLESWLKQGVSDWESIKVTWRMDRGQKQFVFKDPLVSESWRGYHQENAILRPVSKKQNLLMGRGKK